jgi:hypothetical protein
MDSLLLSRITKDFLNQDPAVMPYKRLYRMAWSGSVLASHPQRISQKKSPPPSFKDFLGAMRERISQVVGGNAPKIPSFSTTAIPKPTEPVKASFTPPRYFSRGGWENDRKKNPAPIPYLLIEANETSRPRPIPGNSLLLRSLCKGKGRLFQNNQGFVFLNIDNRFISSLIPYLKAYGLVRPPYFNLFGSPEGAHIPVIPAREMAFQYIDKIQEVGEEFSFVIEGLYSIEPSTWPEMEQVWFFKLSSPELEKLRRSYFLPSTPGGHAFHIAVAVKPKPGFKHQPHPLPPMRINTGFLAA